MIPNYELFLHGFSAIPAGTLGPEAAPLPFWIKAGYGAVAGLVVALSLVIG